MSFMKQRENVIKLIKELFKHSHLLRNCLNILIEITVMIVNNFLKLWV